MVRVIEPAANTALTTIEAAKSYVPDLGALTDDEIVARIARASAVTVSYCGRPFARQVYQERLAGYGLPDLLLSRWPVIEVRDVVCDNLPVLGWELADPERGRLYRSAGWAWTARTGHGLAPHPIAGAEHRPFVVTYEAGYRLPGEDGRDLPGDVEEACLMILAASVALADSDPSVSELRIGPTTVRYRDGESVAIPAAARSRLGPYRDARMF